MITRLNLVTILVPDQDEALDWFTYGNRYALMGL
jgi:hypothetical protein